MILANYAIYAVPVSSLFFAHAHDVGSFSNLGQDKCSTSNKKGTLSFIAKSRGHVPPVPTSIP